MSTQSTTQTFASMVGGIRRLGSLYFENVRLKTTEKITILLAAVAFYAVVMALGLVCLVFVSIGIGHLLATTLAPHLAYLFIAFFYLILFMLTFVWRRQIFIDPIARFMSRLLVEMPEDEREARRSTPKRPFNPQGPDGKNPVDGGPAAPSPEPQPESAPSAADDDVADSAVQPSAPVTGPGACFVEEDEIIINYDDNDEQN